MKFELTLEQRNILIGMITEAMAETSNPEYLEELKELLKALL